MRQSLTDVMQKRGPLAGGHIEAKLGGHQRRDVRTLHKMLEDVLPVRRPVAQRAEHRDERWMEVGDAYLGHRIFGRPQTLRLNLTLAPLVYFLDAGGMNAAIRHQLGQRHPGRLSPNRIEAGQQNCFWRVIDHHVDAGHLFERPDIAALPTDDPTLHVVSREVDRRDDRLRGQLRCQTLDGNHDDLLCSRVCFADCLAFDIASNEHGLALRIMSDRCYQLGLCLLRGQTCNPLQRGLLLGLEIRQRPSLSLQLILEVLKLSTLFLQHANVGVEALFSIRESLFATLEVGRLPADSHVRLAAPSSNGGAALLRRGYSFTDGLDDRLGQLDAGLFFLSFQRDPEAFVRVQRRLGAGDALNEYIKHVGSGVWAIPPGARRGGYVGEGLFV